LINKPDKPVSVNKERNPVSANKERNPVSIRLLLFNNQLNKPVLFNKQHPLRMFPQQPAVLDLYKTTTLATVVAMVVLPMAVTAMVDPHTVNPVVTAAHHMETAITTVHHLVAVVAMVVRHMETTITMVHLTLNPLVNHTAFNPLVNTQPTTQRNSISHDVDQHQPTIHAQLMDHNTIHYQATHTVTFNAHSNACSSNHAQPI